MDNKDNMNNFLKSCLDGANNNSLHKNCGKGSHCDTGLCICSDFHLEWPHHENRWCHLNLNGKLQNLTSSLSKRQRKSRQGVVDIYKKYTYGGFGGLWANNIFVIFSNLK